MKGPLDPDAGAGLDRVIGLAHCHLGLDVAYLAELTSEGHVYRAIAGDLSSFGMAAVDGPPAEVAFCRLLLAGEIPNVVRDAGAHERAAGLAITRQARIGAFIGVPVRLSDGTPYGVLCGLSHTPDHTLDERDVRFMSMLGELIVGDLDEQRTRERLHADLTEVLETEGLVVAYQPIVELDSERCLGIEALARFPKQFGPPNVALAAAETVGLSLELERLVVRKAWEMLPLLSPEQFLALNVSPDALVELARRANLRDDLPLAQIVVEITEHAAVESYAALHGELAPLRKAGLRIAVDDAGAGYASLRHVLELRPDFIKVDRSLIHGIANDHARRVAASAFLSLALDIGSTVVAEGVERPADLVAIRELGMHAVQGYLLGKPSTKHSTVMRWIGAPAQDRQRVLSGA
jgi:EAL domain-containing protein (putative c-di-GMP-specific phosphodiesterase class I)